MSVADALTVWYKMVSNLRLRKKIKLELTFLFQRQYVTILMYLLPSLINVFYHVFQTVSFPVHLTTPHSSATPTTTTRPPSTTLHRIVCPGVFNCSKTCYTGYRLDSQGCPLCECAPLPTGLP